MAGTWTALLASWSNKALSVTRLDQFFSSSGNLQVLRDNSNRLIAAAGAAKTISSGAITVAPVNGECTYSVETEGGAASDDLDTITNSGGSAGDIVTLYAVNTAHVVTVRSDVGNIYLGGASIFLHTSEQLVLRYNGSGWYPIAIPMVNSVPVGTMRMSWAASAEAGWLLMVEGTIGDASSAATIRANADCQNLFLFLWNNLSDSYAPVTGGRGATAAADWAAHKKIAFPTIPGRVPLVAGSGTGLTARTKGDKGGAETHQLTAAEMPSHTHNSQGPSGAVANTGSAVQAGITWLATSSAGSDTAHNNMQPWFGINFFIKL